MHIPVPVVEEALHVVIPVAREGGGIILTIHIQQASTTIISTPRVERTMSMLRYPAGCT